MRNRTLSGQQALAAEQKVILNGGDASYPGPGLTEIPLPIRRGQRTGVRTVEFDKAEITLTNRIQLRYTPHLRFVFDESVGRGDRIDRLLREAKAHDAAAHGEKDPEGK